MTEKRVGDPSVLRAKRRVELIRAEPLHHCAPGIHPNDPCLRDSSQYVGAEVVIGEVAENDHELTGIANGR